MANLKVGKDAILKKALSLFIRKGYQSTSLNQIVQALGVTKGALYHHFESKEQLYYATLVFFFSRNRQNSPLTEPEDFKEKLEQGFHGLGKHREFLFYLAGEADDRTILQFYSFLYDATRRYPEFQETMDRSDKKRQDALAELIGKGQREGRIRKDIDPYLTALEAEALIQQLLYLSFVNPRMKKDKSLVMELFENYWKRFLP